MVVEVPLERGGHALFCGATGSGKSRGLANVFRQVAVRAAAGSPLGCCLVDPNEKRDEGGMFSNELSWLASHPRLMEALADRLLIFDPTDEEYTAGFNVLQPLPGVSPTRQADTNIAATRGIWLFDQRAARMEYIFRRAMIALTETGWTLAEIPVFLEQPFDRQQPVNPLVRAAAKRVANPVIRRFFLEEFPMFPRRERSTWVMPILNKVGRFFDEPQVARVLGQYETSFGDLARVMDEGVLMLVNLSQDALGPINAEIMGGLLASHFSAAAPSRETSHPYFLLMDEIGRYPTDAFSEIVTTRRQHGLFLMGAFQDLQQLEKVEGLKVDLLTNTRHQFFYKIGHPDDAEEIARLLWSVTGLEAKETSWEWVKAPLGIQYPRRKHNYKTGHEERDGHVHRLLNAPPGAVIYHDAITRRVIPAQSTYVPDVPRTPDLQERVRRLYAESAARFGLTVTEADRSLYAERERDIKRFIQADSDDHGPTIREEV